MLSTYPKPFKFTLMLILFRDDDSGFSIDYGYEETEFTSESSSAERKLGL